LRETRRRKPPPHLRIKSCQTRFTWWPIAPVTTDDYKQVFGSKSVTAAQVKEVNHIKKALEERFNRSTGDRTFTDKTFDKTLKATKASFVIVIGHNEHGMLHLLDGSSIFLDDVVTKARQDQRVILISCESASRVSNPKTAGTVKRSITYDEAFELAGAITDFIEAAPQPVSLSEIQAHLAKHESLLKGRKIAYFVTKAVCAGATIVVVGLMLRWLDCKEPDAKCS
jgi:hypothetical protein